MLIAGTQTETADTSELSSGAQCVAKGMPVLFELLRCLTVTASNPPAFTWQ